MTRRACVAGIVPAMVVAGIVGVGPAAAKLETGSKKPPRVALVIGNAAYSGLPSLTNPVNDAKGIAAALKKLGFTVIIRSNASRKAMEDGLKTFGERLTPESIALFYYSGHGVQVDDRNYLIPVDGTVEYAEDVPQRAIDASQILAVLGKARKGTKLFLLDACRNNDLKRRSKQRVQGLARMAAPTGTLIGYATGPNNVASDGFGDYSLYTGELLKVIGKPGQRIENIFYEVREKVSEISGGRQVPVEFTSLTQVFHFLPPPKGVVSKFLYKVKEIDDDYLTLKKLNIRKEPRSDSVRVGDLPAGGKINVTGQVLGGDWYRVEYAKGKSGFVIGTFLRRAVAPRPPPIVDARPIRKAGDRFRDCPKCPEMVVIPAGKFVMGAKSGPRNERPAHEVQIAKSFAMGRFEVTFEQWEACVKEGGCRQTPSDEGWGRGKRPVTNVTWDDAREYTKWLSRKTGEPYSLPSEAQWEYAARAGGRNDFWWGDKMRPGMANCSDCGGKWAGKMTAPVGSFKPNKFGLHDMHGNVWEWVEDCWHGSYFGAPKDGRSWMTGSCRFSVLRGGSWQESAESARAGRRGRYGSAFRPDFGFRVVRVIRQAPPPKPIARNP